MSNMYNQQLKDALNQVKNASHQNELTENNTRQGAKLGLYHAHGLTSKNSNLLSEALEKISDDAKQNHVASIAATATQNIVTVSNTAVVDASNTTSNASTAAASIEKAATALTNLYGNVAQTMAIVNSLDNGSKIQRLVKKADEATKEAARLAEAASILALNMTIDASQSRAANVVTQAGVVKTNIGSLMKSLTSSFAKQQELVTNDLEAMTTAVSAECVQAGIYKTALAEDDALFSSMNFLNEYVNNSLSCAIAGLQNGNVTEAGCHGDQFTLSFNAFKEMEDDKAIIEEYRLILVKEDDLVSFNTEAAKATSEIGYVAIKPDLANPNLSTYSQEYVTADFLNDKESNENARFARDYQGVPVTRGIPYSFFVYVVYTSEYQTNVNDTNGVLSLSAPPFTLLRYLPVVQAADMSLAFYKTKENAAVRVAFKMPINQLQINQETNLNELMEFRTFLFSEKDRQSFELNQQIDAEAEKLYALEATLRQREELCQVARLAYDSALVQEPQDLNDLEKKKKKLTAQKVRLSLAKSTYQDQKLVFENALEQKISDFFIDEGVMETIPKANYMISKKISDTLINELKDSQKTFSKEVDELQKQLDGLDKELEELNKSKATVSEVVVKETTLDNRAKSEIARILQDIDNNTKKLEAIRSEKIKIETADDAAQLQDSIPREQKEQINLLTKILASFELLQATKGEETELSNETEERNTALKKINTEIVLMKAKREIISDQLTDLKQELEMVTQHMTQLKTLIGNDKKGEYYYYEATNSKGDFTDNYGEPLTHVSLGSSGEGSKYCTLILSEIQDNQPEAAKLYQGRMSGFSSPVPYTF